MPRRRQVAVYPVDARGLFINPYHAGVQLSANYADTRAIPIPMQETSKNSFCRPTTENATMQQMAEQTGGHAFINTNGLSQAVASAIDSGSNFYTLTYSPTKPLERQASARSRSSSSSRATTSPIAAATMRLIRMPPPTLKPKPRHHPPSHLRPKAHPRLYRRRIPCAPR